MRRKNILFELMTYARHLHPVCKLIYYILCFSSILVQIIGAQGARAEILDPTGLFVCPTPEGRKTQIITPEEEHNAYRVVEMSVDGSVISDQTLFTVEDQTIISHPPAQAKRIQLFRYSENQNVLFYSITQRDDQYVHQLVEDGKRPIYFLCEMVSPKPSLSELPLVLRGSARETWGEQMNAVDLLFADLSPDLKPVKKEKQDLTDSGLEDEVFLYPDSEEAEHAWIEASPRRRHHSPRPAHGEMEEVVQFEDFPQQVLNHKQERVPPSKRIILTYQTLSKTELRALIKKIQNTPDLVDLQLQGLSLGNSGVIKVLKALEHSHSLKNLNLWGNDMSNRGARSIGRFLRTNRSLVTLTLRGNEISNWGFRGILAGLNQGSPLLALDLFGNRISKKGVEALLKTPPPHLLFLNLYNNLLPQAEDATFAAISKRWHCPLELALRTLDEESSEN